MTKTLPRHLDAALKPALQQYEHWRLHQADYSIKTWAGEKPGLLAFIDCMHGRGHTYLSTITEDDLLAWWDELGLQPSTRKTRLSQLRSFLKFCVRRGYLAVDPSLMIRAKVPAKGPRDRLDAAELLALVDATRCPRDRVLVALAVNLGVRGGEVSRLRIRDLDLDANELTVHVDKTNEVDVMPITSDLAFELRLWLGIYRAVCPQLGKASYLVPSQYVDNQRGRTIYRHARPYSEPYKAVKAALDTLGWEDTKGEGVHTVRRSVATIYFDMIEAEESFDSALVATMSLLHHARPEQTLEYIGRSRAKMARDRVLKGQPFLSKLVPAAKLQLVQ